MRTAHTGTSTGELFSHYPAAPEEVDASADELTTSTGPLEVLIDDVRTSTDAAVHAVAGLLAGPMGSAPRPVRVRARELVLDALYAGGVVRLWARAIAAFNRTVDRLNTQWRSATAGGDPVGAARAELLRRLRREHSRAESTLDEAAADAARRLDRGATPAGLRDLYAAGALPSRVTAVFPDIDWPRGRLPYDLAEMDAAKLAHYLLDHAELDPTRYRLPDPVVDALGEILAQHLHDQGDHLDPDRLDALNERLDRLTPVDGVDAALVDSLNGDGLLEIVSQLARHATGMPDPSAVTTLLASLRRSLTSASSQLTRSQQHDLAEQLVGALPQEYDVTDIDRDFPIALSYLLNRDRPSDDDGFATGFLDALGDQLDHLERDQGIGVDHWDAFTRGSIVDDVLVAGDDPVVDPVAAYMTALADNPDAGLTFFTSDNQGEGSRADYYLKHRRWGHDGFGSLLAALDTATTDDGTMAHRREAAAGLMSSVSDYLSHRDQVFDAGSGERFVPGNIGDDGVRSLAHLLGTYLPAIDYSVSPEQGAGIEDGIQAGQSQRYDRAGLDRYGLMPRLEPGEVSELVKVAATTDAGLDTLREFLSSHQERQLRHAETEPGEFEEIMTSHGTLDGFFQHQISRAQIEIAENDDDAIREANRRTARFIDYGVILANEAAHGIPHPVAKAAYYTLGRPLVSLSADQIEAALTESPTHVEEAIARANGDTDRAFEAAKDRYRSVLQRFDLTEEQKSDQLDDLERAYTWIDHNKDGGGYLWHS